MIRRADVRAMHIRTVLRRVYRIGARRSTPPNPLLRVVRDTMPDIGEAEMDRYRRYHASDQTGR